MVKLETYSSLSTRDKKILKLVIEDFIETASPVPSGRLKYKFHIELSTASIRSTLHSLEGVGLLDHIHVSSGRVPTDLGYRFYVDKLMGEPPTTEELLFKIKKELEEVAFNVEELLQKTANSLSAISHLFGFALFQPEKAVILTELELIQLSSGRILLILGLQSDRIKSVVLDLECDMHPSHLISVASVLRERLLGLTLEEIQKTIGDRLKNDEVGKEELVSYLISHVKSIFVTDEPKEVYTSSKEFLLQNPEFKQSDVVQSVVSVLDDKGFFIHKLSEGIGEEKPESVIGSENEEKALQECSIVAGTFSLGERVGRLGIIGPTRMPYRQAFSMVNLFANALRKV